MCIRDRSKGNAVDPFDALEQHGADAIRWYFYSNSAPWLPNRFHADAVTEGQRKFMGTLWNTYAFYVLYANIDEFDPTKYSLESVSYTHLDVYKRQVSKQEKVTLFTLSMMDHQQPMVNLISDTF